MNEKQKNAVNFLLYSYFGICLDDEWEDMVRAAIMKAYDDATMQGAYNTLFKGNDDSINHLRKSSKEATRKAGMKLEEKLNDFFKSDNNQEIYDTWHNNLCTEIKKCYENVKEGNKQFFTYGNAQKWVNMTVKYVYILNVLIPEKSKYETRMEDCADKIHVPVDSYIIEAVWHEGYEEDGKGRLNKEDLEKLKIKLPVDNNKRINKIPQIPAWSNWKDTDYKNFQDTLRDSKLVKETGDIPIIWENKTWIEQSKKKRKTIKDKFEEKFLEHKK